MPARVVAQGKTTPVVHGTRCAHAETYLERWGREQPCPGGREHFLFFLNTSEKINLTSVLVVQMMRASESQREPVLAQHAYALAYTGDVCAWTERRTLTRAVCALTEQRTLAHTDVVWGGTGQRDPAPTDDVCTLTG